MGVGYDPRDEDAALRRVKEQARREDLRVTVHADEEMKDEGFRLDDVLEAISDGRIIENYPEARRGACCLIYGKTKQGRDVHVVCTTDRPALVIITVYEPKEPKWKNPTTRGNR